MMDMDVDKTYTSFKLSPVAEYKSVFPGKAMPSIGKLLRKYSRYLLLGGAFLSMVNKLVGKPFYNPNYDGDEKNIDALRFFLSEKNKEFYKLCLNGLTRSAKTLGILVTDYSAATHESILYLWREVMSIPITPDQITSITADVEKDFLVALLIANTITISKGQGRIPFREGTELYVASLFVSQFGSVDFLYADNRFLLRSQTEKCIEFFKYVEQSEFSNLLPSFYEKYNISSWKNYLRAFWALFGLTGGKAGTIIVDRVKLTDSEDILNVFFQSSIDKSALITKESNIDYCAFRSSPLIMVSRDQYLLINLQFLCEKLYNSLYFTFRNVAAEKEKIDFKRVFSSDFVQNSLLNDVLKTVFNRDDSFSLSEDECERRDESQDARNVSKPDFYARQGKYVYVFENKDILLSGETKEIGNVNDFIEFFRTRFFKNQAGKPEGVKQLMNLVDKIRSGEFQKRWDSGCPLDAVVYPVLIVPDIKFAFAGIKNFLQSWQKDCEVSMENVKPIALVDLSTLCMYRYQIREEGIRTYLDDYYNRSDYEGLSNDVLPNAMMSFSDYLLHQPNKYDQIFVDEMKSIFKENNE